MTNIRTPHFETIDGQPYQVYSPSKAEEDHRIMLLLHGHLGNEKVMWVLTKPIPDTYTMLAPRAPVQTGPDQYSWHAITPQWPDLETYQSLADVLIKQTQNWAEANNKPVQQIDVMGFSQGAVLALAMGILFPEKVGRTAILAGFLPRTWIADLPAVSSALTNKPFCIAHGTQDEVVPIAKAQRAADWLKEKGADVTFCAADTGHKLSANCFNSLGKFFT